MVTYCLSLTPVSATITLLPLKVGAPAVAVPSVIVAVALAIGLSNVNTIVCAGPCLGSVVGLWLTFGGATNDSGKLKVPAAPCTFRDTALTSDGDDGGDPPIKLPNAAGPVPTGSVATTALVSVSITETLLLFRSAT